MNADPSVLLAASAAEFATAYPIDAGRVRPHKILDGDGFKIRTLTMDAGAVMREHRAPVPILVQVISGRVLFRVGDSEYDLTAGGAIQVPAGILHELEAVDPAHVLLTLLG
ncbi:cupin domain-containing protein [Microbacterium sp. H1-D42]|uniref:cupin domain-containing protein n=1 Tax=Microbacterium sp. H1-D42 TaxID=2925844 RepID=UPI001F53E034|nr:cupin domain-containing protein [Microbacterium sp. H1-D42]UNK71690.1 cupin domain-containing protein [Microbacterium sp. H1-D42]